MEHLSVFLNALLAALMRSAPYLVIGCLIAAVIVALAVGINPILDMF